MSRPDAETILSLINQVIARYVEHEIEAKEAVGLIMRVMETGSLTEPPKFKVIDGDQK